MPREVRVATKNLARKCPRCNKPILKGQRQVIASNSKNGHKAYHVECYLDAKGNRIFE